MDNKDWFDKLQIWVISGVIVTLIATLIVIVYSIGTVNSELHQAFSPAPPSVPAVNFNIGGYNSLGLQ